MRRKPKRFERSAEHELTWMKDKRIPLIHFHQAREIILPLLRINVRIARIIEHAKKAVHSNIDTGRLNELSVKRVDA